jgi:hypothetical protein
MSYRQKQAAATLVALCAVGLGLMARLIQIDPQTMRDAFPILLQTGLAMIVVTILANLALKLHLRSQGGNSSEDERDVLVDLLARRNGYWFATIGLSLVVVQAFRGVSNVGLAETALAAFLVAEVVRYSSRLYFYRRGI